MVLPSGQVIENPTAEYPEARLPILIGDKQRFQQILTSLLKNATKYTQKGKVEIKACYDCKLELLAVMVTDTG